LVSIVRVRREVKGLMKNICLMKLFHPATIKGATEPAFTGDTKIFSTVKPDGIQRHELTVPTSEQLQ
jgi:hypothetical protein